ncbi:peptidoglycan-associated lipoprotein Pal [Arhodomonas sp. SL1]|uniref:peptidoglycan-associated lipoprotein Pal n=1 Tax=Arhodomonas sp. SL1 TaxID=3425691 RepID=UPI003F8820AE
MTRTIQWIFIALLAAALGGCATTDQTESEDRAAADGELAGERAGMDGSEDGAGAEGTGAEARGADGTSGFTSADLDDPASPLSQRIFYFEFDSSQLSPEDVETLTDHAEYLATHPEVSVIIEGHTDERGSREYNLALGERRAQSVADVLTLNGAAGDQVSVVSYGEEKPANPGHNEDAWAENRRAELVYER